MRVKYESRIGLCLGITICFTMVLLGGCKTTESRLQRAIPGKAPVRPADSHMVFNPDVSDLPVTDVPRADWPAAFGSETIREDISYTERIIDRPALFGGQRDRYSRRFNSTRKGRISQ